MFDRGISWEGSLLDMGILGGIVEKSGAWLGYNGNRLGQGRENARKFLLENPAITKEIHQKIMAKHEELANATALKVGTEDGAPAAAAEN